MAAIFVFAGSQHNALSFLTGWGLVLANMLLLALITWLFLQKKWIALAAPLIVIKYAILGIFIYRSMQMPWMEPAYFLAGVASLLVTVLINFAQRKNGV